MLPNKHRTAELVMLSEMYYWLFIVINTERGLNNIVVSKTLRVNCKSVKYEEVTNCHIVKWLDIRAWKQESTIRLRSATQRRWWITLLLNDAGYGQLCITWTRFLVLFDESKVILQPNNDIKIMGTIWPHLNNIIDNTCREIILQLPLHFCLYRCFSYMYPMFGFLVKINAISA